MLKSILSLFTFILITNMSFAQNSVAEEIKTLSKNKWQWMADKDVDKLGKLFDNQAMFVHMGGSWGKERELEIIKSGFIHYKKKRYSRSVNANNYR